MKTYKIKEIERMSQKRKKEYYMALRDECKKFRSNKFACSKLISLFSPLLCGFPIEIRGRENLPLDDNVLVAANHSNSHDVFVAKEAFARNKRKLIPFVAWDGLNIMSRFAFYLCDATFVKRNDKNSTEKGLHHFCGKILNGKDGIIWGESTWNLHPVKPMQKIKVGVVQIALITGKPIVPIIFEYVEVPRICKKEKELYQKCVVQIGKPIYITAEKSIFEQTDYVMKTLVSMRESLWKELGIYRQDISEINQDIYLNHLYVKKFKAFGFQYNSELETQFLIDKENEFHLDEQGCFKPGILIKKL